MSKFKFTKSTYGFCDVTVTLFTKDNTWVIEESRTFDSIPTIKELKETYKPYKKNGAFFMRVVSTPSCCVKIYKL